MEQFKNILDIWGCQVYQEHILILFVYKKGKENDSPCPQTFCAVHMQTIPLPNLPPVCAEIYIKEYYLTAT